MLDIKSLHPDTKREKSPTHITEKRRMAASGGDQWTTSPEQIEESTHAEILELMEPGLGGFQLLEQLRNHPNPKPRKIPVVVYTVKELTGEERERLRQQTQGRGYRRSRGRDHTVMLCAQILSKLTDGRVRVSTSPSQASALPQANHSPCALTFYPKS